MLRAGTAAAGGQVLRISRQSGGSSKHCCRDVNPISACSKSSLCHFAMRQMFSLLRAAISSPLRYVLLHLKPVPRFIPSPKSLRHSQNTCQMFRGATELTQYICRKRFVILKEYLISLEVVSPHHCLSINNCQLCDISAGKKP